MSTPSYEKALALLREPETLHIVCGRVAEGETLLEVARSLEIPYGTLFSWVRATEERETEYNMALEARRALIEDKVIGGIMKASDFDIRDIFDDAGELIPIKQLSKETAQSLASVEILENEHGERTKKVRPMDRLRSLELLGKHRSMFTDRHEVAADSSFANLVKESMQGPKE